MTLLSEETWSALEGAPRPQAGALRSQRIAPESLHDLFAVIESNRDRRGLWFRLDTSSIGEKPEMPELRAITVQYVSVPDEESHQYLAIYLDEQDLRRVFTALIGDVASAIVAESDPQAALEAVSQRLHRWERLLRPAATEGLTRDEIRGLVGELLVMGALLDEGFLPITVTQGWTGPYRGNQDFQIGDLAVEVKSTIAKQPQSLIVTNERELDDTGVDVLLLAHMSLDERQGGAGQNLLELVDTITGRVEVDPSAVGALSMGLIQYGLLPDHRDRYTEPHFLVRERNYYVVTDDFPRIVESALPEGVGDVRYRIQIAALSAHRQDLTVAIQSGAHTGSADGDA